jgi:hypothetical protein
MKITIFIPKEIRKPHQGDWFFGEFGSFTKCRHSDYQCEHAIYEKHEIEVPEGATCMSYHFRDACVQLNTNYGVIELPQKKVKVKKHQYVHLHTDHCGRKRAEVTGWLSEPEALVKFAHEWAQKISGTEIEIEE